MIRFPEKASDFNSAGLYIGLTMAMDLSYKIDNLRRGIIIIFDALSYGFEHTLKFANAQMKKFKNVLLVSNL